MSPQPVPAVIGAEEINPFLLYRVSGNQAAFAMWRLAAGEEALALFSDESAAAQYRAALPESSCWVTYQPSPLKLIEILEASIAAQIRFAALNPSGDSARTLFDLLQVVEAAKKREP
jgi:hypothetical protein